MRVIKQVAIAGVVAISILGGGAASHASTGSPGGGQDVIDGSPNSRVVGGGQDTVDGGSPDIDPNDRVVGGGQYTVDGGNPDIDPNNRVGAGDYQIRAAP